MTAPASRGWRLFCAASAMSGRLVVARAAER